MLIDFGTHIDINSLFPQTEFEEKVIYFIEEWYRTSPTVQVQTSGSTGQPKIFDIQKEKMRFSARMTCDFLGLKPGDSALICLPVEYISGKMMVVRAIERKLKLLVKPPSAKPLDDLKQTIDFCALSPLQAENSIEKLNFIKNIIIGGAQVAEGLQQKIKVRLDKDCADNRIYETYGMSETLSHIALKQLYPERSDYFKIFPGISITADERNCLIINAPQLNTEILKTNDIVELKDNEEFKFIGRVDNVINSGGLKIHPEALEEILKHTITDELIFTSLPDEKLGEKLILVAEAQDSSELRRKLEITYSGIQKLYSKHHIPKEVYFLPEFPRLPNGKINRRKILELL